MTLYFGTVQAALSTLLLIVILGYFVFTAARQAQMTHWGRRTGLLAADGFIATLCYAGGAAVAIVLLFCLFVRKQLWRKRAFFALGGIILLKTLLVEISRWVVQ